MLDFDIKKCTRQCAVTQRDLNPGEAFYSVLVPEGGDVIREDYCVDAWKGPPDHAIGWWKSQVPDPSAKRVHWAPNDVMLHYFLELNERPESADVRYVLTLLMIRRRILRLDATEHDQEGNETFIVYCPRNESEYRVDVISPGSQRIDEIQNELAKLLFAHAS